MTDPPIAAYTLGEAAEMLDVLAREVLAADALRTSGAVEWLNQDIQKAVFAAMTDPAPVTRVYTSPEDVARDFGTDSPEYRQALATFDAERLAAGGATPEQIRRERFRFDDAEARFFTTQLGTDREPAQCIVCSSLVNECRCTPDQRRQWLDAHAP